MKKLGVACVASVLLAAGCSKISMPSMPWSSQAAETNPTAEALFAEAMKEFESKRYARAIDRFQRVKAEFPFSPNLIQAELKLAEAYYLNKQYPEAVAALREFQTLHPTNENIPLVVYYLGLAHFDQFTSIDRDQKMTEIAKGHFETVVRNHPNSPYAEKAREKLARSEQYLADHEYNIARFYFNEKSYAAATDRLEDILRRYPNAPVAPQALFQLGESYRLQKNTAKAALAYQALMQHYPATAQAKQAQAQLTQLENQKVDPLALLLAPERRPAFVPPPTTATNSTNDIQFVAKKEVVHEEPGSEKGFFGRVAEKVNPLNWFSSSDDEKNEAQSKAAVAKKETPRPEPGDTRQLLAKVDESLSEKGIESDGKKLQAPAPAAAELPKDPAEPGPRPSDATAILATIDTRLEKEGKKTDGLPPTPEIAPVLQTVVGETGAPAGGGVTPAAGQTVSSASTTEVLSSIDEALRKKGIEPKAQASHPAQSSVPPKTPASAAPAQAKVELAPRLPAEKGPLFLESGEFQAKGDAGKGEAPGSQDSAKPAEAPKSIPQSVVKSPSPIEPAPTAEKGKPEGEQEKSGLDQLREDLRSLGNLLNPFNW
jgi:outer membrane protein assembly factor BamD